MMELIGVSHSKNKPIAAHVLSIHYMLGVVLSPFQGLLCAVITATLGSVLILQMTKRGSESLSELPEVTFFSSDRDGV